MTIIKEDYSVDCRDCRNFDNSKLRTIEGCLGQCRTSGRGIMKYKQECCLDFSGEAIWKENFILW